MPCPKGGLFQASHPQVPGAAWPPGASVQSPGPTLWRPVPRCNAILWGLATVGGILSHQSSLVETGLAGGLGQGLCAPWGVAEERARACLGQAGLKHGSDL